MFSDDELKSILRYIDMYHNSTHSTMRTKAIKFLTVQLGEKFPTITDERVVKFIDSISPELESIKPEDFDVFLDDKQENIPVSRKGSLPTAQQHDSMSDRFRDDPYMRTERPLPYYNHKPYDSLQYWQHPPMYERYGFLTERHGLVNDRSGILNDRRGFLTERPGFLADNYTTMPHPRPAVVIPKLDLWKIEREQENDDFMHRSHILGRGIDNYRRSMNTKTSIKDRLKNLENVSREKDAVNKYEVSIKYPNLSIPPLWMSREEREFYQSLDDKEKMNLLENYKIMMDLEEYKVHPIRFQVLLSNIPYSKKAEIFTRLDSSFSISGENLKYSSWVKSLLKIPFEVYTPLPFNC